METCPRCFSPAKNSYCIGCGLHKISDFSYIILIKHSKHKHYYFSWMNSARLLQKHIKPFSSIFSAHRDNPLAAVKFEYQPLTVSKEFIFKKLERILLLK